MTEEKKGFVVKDRRIFAEENREAEEKEKQTPREDSETKEKREEAAAPKEKPDEKPDERSDEKPDDKPDDKSKERPAAESIDQTQLPEINFPTFIFSLNSSALVQLGLIDDPATGNKTKNLILAKQTIDILGMLEEKTRGNLSSDEENMLKSLLYDLRMIYVKEKG